MDIGQWLPWFFVCLVLVFAINLVPAFMPSSWMIMAFFHVRFEVPLILLCITGAIVSGLGRACLYAASTLVTRTFFKQKQADLEKLGGVLEEKKQLLPIVVFLYSLTPLPTNNLFVAGGMVSANLLYVLIGFWAARIPADLFWAWSSSTAFHSFKDVFARSGSWLALVLQLGAVGSMALLYLLPWGKWLGNYLSSDQACRKEPTARPGL